MAMVCSCSSKGGACLKEKAACSHVFTNVGRPVHGVFIRHISDIPTATSNFWKQVVATLSRLESVDLQNLLMSL